MEQRSDYFRKELAADGMKPAAAVAAAQQIGADGRCLRIRCRVEWMPAGDAPAPVAETRVVADTLTALPRTCPFVDIVPATLYYLGYNMTDVIGATGTVQIRNWKPVSCDVITDNLSATVDDVLGDQLASITTLRIRLRSCFRPVPRIAEDVKDKLLTYLFDRLRTTLAATGCPISDALLSQILRGELNGADHQLSEATLRSFEQWFSSQVDSAVKQASNGQRASASGDSDRESSSSPDAQRRANVDDTEHYEVGGVSDDGEDRRDHQNDDERSPSPPPPAAHTFDSTYECPLPPPLKKLAKELPVLPNRNAVYVADAIMPPETVDESRDGRYGNGVREKTGYDDEEEEDSGEEDLEVVLPSANPSPTTDAQMEMEFAGGDKGEEQQHDISAAMDTFPQEEATDLSLPKQNGGGGDRHLAYDRADEKNGDSGAAADYFSSGGSSGSEGGSSAQSPTIQTPPPHGGGLVPPPHAFLLNPSAAMAAAGLFSQSAAAAAPPSLPSPFYHHQRALQLAAMSRAAGFGFPFHHGNDVAQIASKPGIRPAHGYSSSSSHITAGYSLSGARPVVTTAMPGTEPGGAGVKRSRVFIDPLTEIPRLERWFADDTHPSSYVIEKYTEELNRSPYRQRFPRLEPKNLQLWFKNHRAKMKRQRDACLAAAAAAAAAAAKAMDNGGGNMKEDCVKMDDYQHQQAAESARPASCGGGGVDAARAFQNGEPAKVDGDRTSYGNGCGSAAAYAFGKHEGAAFPTSAGRSFAVIEDPQDRTGRFFEHASAGSGSALDELVLRLRSGPLGRLPESAVLQQPTSTSCVDQ